jgi:hypothetical protein
MDIYNNKIVSFDKDCNKSEYKYEIDVSLDLLQRIKELVKLTVKEIPFSLVRSKIMLLVSENENREFILKAEEIIYHNGKNKFREMLWIEYGVLVISAFNKILNKCIFLVSLNNQIYGFVSFAGTRITNGMFFENNLSLNWMIEQIKNEIPNNIPENLLKLKKIVHNDKIFDLEELWNNEAEIIISLEPECFYNKTKDIQNNVFENNYINNIVDIGLDKYMKMFFNYIKYYKRHII